MHAAIPTIRLGIPIPSPTPSAILSDWLNPPLGCPPLPGELYVGSGAADDAVIVDRRVTMTSTTVGDAVRITVGDTVRKTVEDAVTKTVPI
jgi:hypothetical protein